MSDEAAQRGLKTAEVIAQLLLIGTLRKPGVWRPEQATSTQMFGKAMGDRTLETHQLLLPDSMNQPFETFVAEC
ncbi:hypothetical protein K9N68_08310 [Kovacikia minuta CCNUW1]|uniref:hypothetical protein n=1 Tax=Kovacikia minuta TaxID=2931930 RepID=UPI001CC932CA|nr:hypothetical protein [Kovacikia minuta]UBF27888.1 hypothetical protein K9N68_08310 [Kovacikia minuta CCNUW1]